MPRIPFADLPDHGRMWVFPTDRPLAPGALDRVTAEIDDFLEGWAAHGSALLSGREIVEDRFVVVAVDEDAAAASGCSIDALTGRLEQLGAELGVGLVGHGSVWYRNADGIHAVSRAEFKKLRDAGLVDQDTSVFDTSLTRVEAFRKGHLERPARDTWHGRAFFGAGTAG